MARGHANLCEVPLESQWAVWSVIRSTAQGIQDGGGRGRSGGSIMVTAASEFLCPTAVWAGPEERAEPGIPAFKGLPEKDGPGGGHTGYMRQGPRTGPRG